MSKHHHCEYYFDPTDRAVYLTSVYVDYHYRGRGIATRAIRDVALYARRMGANRIKLDDMSENYRQVHNIYVKLGLTYDDATSGCEMQGTIEHVLALCDLAISHMGNTLT